MTYVHGNNIHQPNDLCRNYLEPCRIDPKTGQPYDPQEVPGPEGKEGK